MDKAMFMLVYFYQPRKSMTNVDKLVTHKNNVHYLTCTDI